MVSKGDKVERNNLKDADAIVLKHLFDCVYM